MFHPINHLEDDPDENDEDADEAASRSLIICCSVIRIAIILSSYSGL